MQDTLWSGYAADKLSAIEIAQFQRAIAKPMTAFADRVIRPFAFRPDLGCYLSIQQDQYAAGRNHLVAEALASQSDADWAGQTYFTNPLRIDQPVFDDTGKAVWTPPKERVELGPVQIFTFEFDDPRIEFLQQQLGWLRSHGSHPTDSPIGEVYRACSQWIDFRGLTVNWSGNKSLHIHFVFSTGHVTAKSGIRAGHRAHWRKLKTLIMDILKPGVEPDQGMEQAERYRRLPNGSRTLEKPNLLGMPGGTQVTQVTLWERFLERSPRGSSVSFFDPGLFVAADDFISGAARRYQNRPHEQLTGQELAYCGEKMAAHFSGWPSFECFVNGPGNAPRAMFRNAPSDRHASSYMDLDFRTVNIVGSNPMGLTPATVKLPKPLGDMLADWRAEYDAIHNQKRSEAELAFAESVHDAKSGADAIRRVLFNAVQNDDLSFIVAPEGIAKTSTLFRQHGRIAAWMKAKGHEGGVMFAFATYQAAAEKCAEFNAVQSGPYRGILIESFDRAYQGACERLGCQKLTLGDAVAMGADNLFTAIERLQPQVLDDLAARHGEAWIEIGSKRPVFFTVHAVAHRWATNSLSRLMASPRFWIGDRSTEHTALCRADTALALLIHDEIKADDLVAAYPAEIVDWVEGLRQSNPDVWDGLSTAAQRYVSYSAYLQVGDPVIDGKPQPVDFETVTDIIETATYPEWDAVLTQDSGEYRLRGGRDIYSSRLDRPWKIIERQWAAHVAEKTIVLTTESLPMALADAGQLNWRIYDLEAPRLPRDRVETQLRKGLRSKDLPKVCAAWRKLNPDFIIISNRIAQIPDTFTHHAARGSNRLMTDSIMQTMVYVSPDEFEYLEALNAWAKRSDLIRLRHIDEFNQSAGRNLGFRRREGTRHVLLINEGLFEILTGQPAKRARYEMAVNIDRRLRRKAARTGKVYAQAVIEPTEAAAFQMAVLREKLLEK